MCKDNLYSEAKREMVAQQRQVKYKFQNCKMFTELNVPLRIDIHFIVIKSRFPPPCTNIVYRRELNVRMLRSVILGDRLTLY